MTAQAGRNLLLKLDQASTGSFQTVAGLRTRRIALNASSVDITNADSAGRWRELLSQAGTRSASLAGSGLFRDQASDAAVRQIFFDGTMCPWQVVIPDFGTLEGLFQVTALEYAGRHDGEVTYEIALESAGEVSFAAD
ncbi:phage major tail protein, TP901-1 family [Roseibium algae]|uniref:Phage major tail protein, TP901-1 family n=1 Tax=Roseibium algae TaxID=3123038 RepID=A0ABU8TK14_9HYPH